MQKLLLSLQILFHDLIDYTVIYTKQEIERICGLYRKRFIQDHANKELDDVLDILKQLDSEISMSRKVRKYNRDKSYVKIAENEYKLLLQAYKKLEYKIINHVAVAQEDYDERFNTVKTELSKSRKLNWILGVLTCVSIIVGVST